MTTAPQPLKDTATPASPAKTDATAWPWRVLLLPGWLDSGAQHWQSHWERLQPFERVQQDDWLWPRRGDWMARLDEVVLSIAPPPSPPHASTQGDLVLVAHSLGCQLVAAWAAHSQHTARIRAALLVAPPDTERDDMPPNLHNWRPIVRQRLPFAATAVVSSNDPFCAPERAQAMAQAWGADVVTVGPRGHINHESNLAAWPEGLALLRRWID